MPSILVCVKQVLDEMEIRVDKETRSLIIEDVPIKLSTIDRNALEEAVRIKEKHGGTVMVVTVSSKTPADEKVMKEAVAMGADAACVVNTNSELDPLDTAKLIAEVYKKGNYDLILFGEGSNDEYNCAVGPMVAELLGLPVITFVKRIEMADGRIIAERDLEDKTVTLEAPLPAIVTVVNEINEPRIPTLIQVIKASKKPLTRYTPADLGVELGAQGRREVKRVEAFYKERKGVIIEEEDPKEAVKKLLDHVREVIS